jgi:hypothetical protein
MSALTFWEAGMRPRSDEVPVDEDALIDAVLRPEEPDDDAGIDLARCCAKCGVMPMPLDK